MTLRSLLRQTVTVQAWSSGAVDEYGQPTQAFSAGREYPGRLEQTGSQEITEGRDTRISDWRLILPPWARVSALDRVVDEAGRTFEVVGAPAFNRGTRADHHIDVRLRLVEG